MTKRIGFLIDHGVELRHFVLSGLMESYRNNGDDVVFLLANDFNTPFFNEYIESYELETQLLQNVFIECKASKWESRLRSLRDARKNLLNEPIYSHLFKKTKIDKRLQLISRISSIYKLIHLYGLRRIRNHYLIDQNIDAIKKLNLNKVIMLEYGSTIKSLFGLGANHLNIDCEVFINTLKTFYINDFLAFKPTKLFCWIKHHEESYYQNNWYYPTNFVRSFGSPFHTFLRKKSEVQIQQVCEKYGIEENRTLVLYSLIFEKVYRKEHLIIEKIYNYLQAHYKESERPQIAIRRNPFEEDDSVTRYLKNKCPDLIVCDHFWERNASKNWSLQSIQGELEWRALLYRADLLLNIPSMSTIDAMMTETMTGNIYFNEKGNYNSEVQHILDSPFAKLFSASKFVKEIYEPSDIESMLNLQTFEFDLEIERTNLSIFS